MQEGPVFRLFPSPSPRRTGRAVLHPHLHGRRHLSIKQRSPETKEKKKTQTPKPQTITVVGVISRCWS